MFIWSMLGRGLRLFAVPMPQSSQIIERLDVLSKAVEELNRKVDALSKKVDEPVHFVGFADKTDLEKHIREELTETVTVLVQEAKKVLPNKVTEEVVTIMSVNLPT